MTKETVQKIAELRKAKTPNIEICRQLNIKISTLHYWVRRLRKAGTKIPKLKSPGRPRLELDNTTQIQPEGQ